MYSSRLSKFGTWVEGAGVLASRFFTGWCGGLGWCGDHPDATPPCSCFHTSWVYLRRARFAGLLARQTLTSAGLRLAARPGRPRLGQVATRPSATRLDPEVPSV